MRRAAIAWSTLAAACSAGKLAEPCGEDRDCPAGESCVSDGTRGDFYCARACGPDAGCQPDRACFDLPSAAPEGGRVALCLHRVRSCRLADGGEPPEWCNGLDDDCDGKTDEDCALVACRFDGICGIYACAPGAPDGGTGGTCRAAAGPAPAYQPCTFASDCTNANCFQGRCAPLCIGNAECASDFRCATRFVSSTPRYNHCLAACKSVRCATAGAACVLAPNLDLGGAADDVCLLLDGRLSSLGAPCGVADTCASQMCASNGVCTHRCAVKLDCADMAGTECQGDLATLPGPVQAATRVCR